MFSRAWYWLHVFPRMVLATCFPAHGIGYMFPRAWYWLHVLPSMVCWVHVFPRITPITNWMFYREFCLTFWLAIRSTTLEVIGSPFTLVSEFLANILYCLPAWSYVFMISCSFCSYWWSAKCNSSFQQGPKGRGKLLQSSFKRWTSQ